MCLYENLYLFIFLLQCTDVSLDENILLLNCKKSCLQYTLSFFQKHLIASFDVSLQTMCVFQLIYISISKCFAFQCQQVCNQNKRHPKFKKSKSLGWRMFKPVYVTKVQSRNLCLNITLWQPDRHGFSPTSIPKCKTSCQRHMIPFHSEAQMSTSWWRQRKSAPHQVMKTPLIAMRTDSYEKYNCNSSNSKIHWSLDQIYVSWLLITTGSSNTVLILKKNSNRF